MAPDDPLGFPKNYLSTQVAAVVVAAGSGTRFGGSRPKTLELLAGKPVVVWALEAFARHPQVLEIVLVVPAKKEELFRATVQLDFPLKIVPGGLYRIQSVARGFKATDPNSKICLIHDGARPLVTVNEIDEVIQMVEAKGAAILAAPALDTLKSVAHDGSIIKTVDRRGVWRAQTPQGFTREILEKALTLGLEDPEMATDEAILVERLVGAKVFVVPGSERNIKITTPQDLALAESLAQSFSPAGQRPPGGQIVKPSGCGLKVGEGWDFHRFNSERPLWLGGIFIPDYPGLDGHSDADVLAHALIDALLGAAGLGDIGEKFPDTEEAFRGAKGATLLAKTSLMVQEAGYKLVNADLTLIGEKPRLTKYRAAMVKALAKALKVQPGLINVKATTTEKMGFTGRGEGLAASALVLLKSVSKA
ncbi:MAG: 2-C-methyl-D-erythritol 4-phosphate cytidylyltransferase [Deltaproteobacteria bacterium]|jgi:2-C-methyl-D-erythritol 4-phosphate cytidylyltransferase/2-C-methyl-D-erythritol 2,4-cyclodiphosphate synthase|nr:2-C-methyl-D-erythritol 4-phosphate cytidylyltransferase [Deltaproteobacteria bacterium]